MLHILIVDDHPIIRSGLKLMLKPNIPGARLYDVSNGDDLVAMVRAQPIDIVLMDLNIPDMDPQRIVHTLLAIRPDIGIIIFSMNREEIFGKLYLKLGAKGYIVKGSEEAEIVDAVKCVAGGGIYMKKDMQQYYFNDLGEHLNPFSTLSKKEMEVLRHLAQGESVGNITRIMNIGKTTVSTHKAKIFEKLHINNMFELKAIIDLHPLS
jgi:two-component system invasion response regulator UvrY